MKISNDGFLSLFTGLFLRKAGWGAMACALLVYIVTMPFMVKPLYESEAIVYAPLVILSQQLDQQGIGFASEREIDWYIQVLKSSQLADSLMAWGQLGKAYRPGNVSPNDRNRLFLELASKLKIEKTRYGSVSVKVSDPDPNRAAALANKIVSLGEKIKAQLLYPNRLESLANAQGLFNQKALEIAAFEKRLDSLDNLPQSLSKKKMLYDKTQTLYRLELQEFVARKNRLEKAKRDFETPLPKAYIVSEARPHPSPVKPQRLLWMILGVAAYLLLLTGIEILKRDFGQAKT